MFNLKFSFRNSILIGFNGEQLEVLNEAEYSSVDEWYADQIDRALDAGFVLA